MHRYSSKAAYTGIYLGYMLCNIEGLKHQGGKNGVSLRALH